MPELNMLLPLLLGIHRTLTSTHAGESVSKPSFPHNQHAVIEGKQAPCAARQFTPVVLAIFAEQTQVPLKLSLMLATYAENMSSWACEINARS